MKSNLIFNLCKYDIKRILNKKYIIELYIIVIAFIMINSGYQCIENYKVWDISLVMQTEIVSLSIIAAVVSVYISNYIAFDMKMSRFINIRMDSKLQWFISKVISIILLNLFIISVMVFVSIIIGVVYGGLSYTWTYEENMFFYKIFYSPYKIIFINILTFTLFLSFLEIVGLIVSLVFKNYKVGITIVFLYIISSPLLTYFGKVRVKKYFAFTSYILFGNRNYYNKDIEFMYLTVKQALVIPMILFIILFVIGLFIIRNLEIDIGAKKNG